MRAAVADRTGSVESGGVEFGYDVFGAGDTTVLLMPTWTIVHARMWKFQTPYLARHYQVVTYDGPGNGTAPRSTDPSDYAMSAFVRRGVDVMDELGIEKAVVVGFSDGGKMAAAFAAQRADRVQGLVLIAPNLELAPPSPDRASIADDFFEPYPQDPSGWQKYNAAYWQDHYEDFLEFFFSELFSEPYTTKHREDGVGWGLETSGLVLKAEALGPEDPDHMEIVSSITVPTLVVHGTDDRLIPVEVSRQFADLTGASLLTMEGTGHAPHMKEPVRFNLALRDFVESLR